MPLAHHVCPVSQLPQLAGQRGQVRHQPRGLQRLQRPLLPPDVEGVAACEQRGPAGRAHLTFSFMLLISEIYLGSPTVSADLLTVGLLEQDAVPGELLHVGGEHLLVVPGHVVPAEVVRQQEDDVGLPGALRDHGHRRQQEGGEQQPGPHGRVRGAGARSPCYAALVSWVPNQ